MHPNAFWQQHAKRIDPEDFRGHWQYLDCAEYPYAEMYAWCKEHRPTWPAKLQEDGAFGCPTETMVDGKVVSRDLLDSIVELSFLASFYEDLARGAGLCGDEAGALKHASVLDIGAGYGRLAHRFQELWPLASVDCVDPVIESVRVCLKYLDFRDVLGIVSSSPAEHCGYDLAINTHSWSECSHESVCEWIAWLRDHNVPRLFVVPHPTPVMLGTYDEERGGGYGPSYHSDLMAAGYRVVHHWNGPECWPRDFYLFERS